MKKLLLHTDGSAKAPETPLLCLLRTTNYHCSLFVSAQEQKEYIQSKLTYLHLLPCQSVTAQQSPDCQVGVDKKDITLIITNLHTLTANQMAKFVGANQDYGTIEAHNVNKAF